MQVDNVKSSQNFGMALKISKGGREYLSKQSEQVLSQLGKIGDEMKDYKHWDLFVNENGCEVVQKGSNVPHCYNGSVRINPDSITNKYNPDSLEFDTYIGGNYANSGQQISLKYDNLDLSEVTSVKKSFEENKFNQFSQFAEFVRFLERRSAETAKIEAEKAAAETRKNGIIDDLMSKFSTEA